MVDTAFFSTHDYDGERAGFNINIAEITGDVATLTTAVATLRTATTAIMADGGIEKTGFTDVTYNTPVPVTNPFAQRETKFQITVVDTNGDRFASNEIPMADLSLLQNGSPYIIKGGVVVGDDTGSVISNFVTAYEAIALSPGGLAVTIWDMYQVGRNI